MLLPGRQMPIPTRHPHAGGFLLRLVQASPQGWAKGGEGIDSYGFHAEDLSNLHN